MAKATKPQPGRRTLRDDFAIACVADAVAIGTATLQERFPGESASEYIARLAYSLADCLMAERKRVRVKL